MFLLQGGQQCARCETSNHWKPEMKPYQIATVPETSRQGAAIVGKLGGSWRR
jgi:hypothetical protein